MYPLEINPTAIQVIQRSITCHPSTFAEALQNRMNSDSAYAATQENASIRKSVIASYSAAKLALEFVQAETAESFAGNMAAGIIALNIACKLQCLPPHIRTSAAWC